MWSSVWSLNVREAIQFTIRTRAERLWWFLPILASCYFGSAGIGVIITSLRDAIVELAVIGAIIAFYFLSIALNCVIVLILSFVLPPIPFPFSSEQKPKVKKYGINLGLNCTIPLFIPLQIFVQRRSHLHMPDHSAR